MVDKSSGSSSLHVSCSHLLFPPMEQVSTIQFIAFIHIFTSILAVIGNLLVGVTIACDTRLRTFTNYFVLSLSIADGIVGLIGQPLMAYLLWNKGETACVFQKVQYFTGSVSCGASGLLLSLVSIERYLQICKPFVYERYVDGKKVTCAIIAFSLGSMALTSISFTSINRSVYSAMLLGFFIASLLYIIPCYVLIYLTAAFHVREVDNGICRADVLQAKKSRRSTKTIFVVVVAFMCCWAPFFILNLIWALDGSRKPHRRMLYTMFYYALTLGYCNSCLNPLLYTFNNTNLRDGILRTVVKVFGKRASALCCIEDKRDVLPDVRAVVPSDNQT